MKDKEVLVNIQAALQRVLPNIPGGMQNLKCLAIQSGTTPSLPIYVSKGNLILTALTCFIYLLHSPCLVMKKPQGDSLYSIA